jgi:hypothetical protein
LGAEYLPEPKAIARGQGDVKIDDVKIKEMKNHDRTMV